MFPVDHEDIFDEASSLRPAIGGFNGGQKASKQSKQLLHDNVIWLTFSEDWTSKIHWSSPFV